MALQRKSASGASRKWGEAWKRKWELDQTGKGEQTLPPPLSPRQGQFTRFDAGSWDALIRIAPLPSCARRPLPEAQNPQPHRHMYTFTHMYTHTSTYVHTQSCTLQCMRGAWPWHYGRARRGQGGGLPSRCWQPAGRLGCGLFHSRHFVMAVMTYRVSKACPKPIGAQSKAKPKPSQPQPQPQPQRNPRPRQAGFRSCRGALGCSLSLALAAALAGALAALPMHAHTQARPAEGTLVSTYRCPVPTTSLAPN